MPSSNDIRNRRRRGKVKTTTIADTSWHTLPTADKAQYEPIGSVYRLSGTAYTKRLDNEMGLGERFRLEWGSRGGTDYRGTVTVHGTAEQARALMTHAYRKLRISENKPDKSVVQEYIQSFCVLIKHSENDSGMWKIAKEIPDSDPEPTQYARAQSFLRSLLIRTLRNIYIRATGEEII